MPAFSAPALSSIALTALPRTPARLSWCPLKTTPTKEGWGRGFFVKGDGQKTHSRAEKKAYENYITKK
jgi:hypothetical protein